jgi:hypothetical protein
VEIRSLQPVVSLNYSTTDEFVFTGLYGERIKRISGTRDVFAFKVTG